MKKVILLLSILYVLPTFADVTLDFGVYTTNKPSMVYNQFRPLLDVIENNIKDIIGEKVEIYIHIAQSYEEGIEHLSKGKVDFSRFGPVAYVMVKRENPNIRIIATEKLKNDGEFSGIIIVHKLSNVKTIKELKGLSFAFGSKSSYISRYLAQRHLYQNGITSKSLSKYEYLERHDRVGVAVGLGQFDAGALNENTFNKLKNKGVPIKEITRFNSVTNPWVARGNLPEGIYRVLQRSLLQINSNTHPSIKAIGVDSFGNSSDRDYEDIRDAIENNKKFFDLP